ncbi:mycothione reductase [Tessaracoccus sp. OH4464_COT-324]|uniref:mycothione reductase n=1 Tax=Tessaracoccus sp. OH4464_COT-324 TaxID=2491059 RepID=UPI000F639282|nr:mycothione reductase [Tessaracoccus sp. OH4464_COT-324]RRD46441.1 mycothione reductase [Tessaracoccus sp. OH4464_COT-324]
MQHFDIAVIGSGSGNSLIDDRFADRKVALIERHSVFGGTCLNRGCIPTKMYVYPSDLLSGHEEAEKLGLSLTPGRADWPAIRERIFGRLDSLSESGLRWRQDSENVTVFQGEASFVDPHTLSVGDELITADQIVLATGSRPRMIEAPIATEVEQRIHTSDTVMRINELPERMVILGGGYIAMEFAHIFTSLGVDVTIVHRSDVLLRGHDEAVSARVAEQMRERVKLRFNQQVSCIEEGPADDIAVITADSNGVEYEYLTDLVLVAIGRQRNYEALNLDAAGVAYAPDGQVRVDATQRTSQPHIWALGDISSDYLLKHVANHEMRVVQHNLLGGEPIESDHRYVPAAVFTKPQVACVGATEQQLRDWGVSYVAKVQEYAGVAHGWAMESQGHFVKLLADPVNWYLLGAHIVGPQAATLIQPLIQAMSFGLTVPEMARGQYWIHPALPEVVENALLGLLQQQPSGDPGA